MLKRIIILSIVLISFSYQAKPPKVSGKRMPSKPYISGDGFRAMSDHVFDETDKLLEASTVEYADIVFVKSDLLDVFFSTIHVKINNPYILISHNSDAAVPAGFIDFLGDEKVLHWFGQNPTIQDHSKFSAIPIGLANRYVHNAGNVSDFTTLFQLKSRNNQKTVLLGINFNPHTNLKARKDVFDYFDNKLFSSRLFASDHLEYLKKMLQAKFILSPPGNGFDCHRTWEALIVGVVPVVLSSPMDELFKNMPVLIVDDWRVVDEDFLNESYEHIQKNMHALSTEKMTYDYWQQLLSDMQRQMRSQSKKKRIV
ncbi:MAG: hypothetical protein WD055_02560 [Candidatus Dependentiae bacterium]